MAPSSLLKNAVVAFFNLAKRRAKLAAARKSSVFQTLDLASLPCDAAARLVQRAASRRPTASGTKVHGIRSHIPDRVAVRLASWLDEESETCSTKAPRDVH
jgi:hypothetical protein